MIRMDDAKKKVMTKTTLAQRLGRYPVSMFAAGSILGCLTLVGISAVKPTQIKNPDQVRVQGEEARQGTAVHADQIGAEFSIDPETSSVCAWTFVRVGPALGDGRMLRACYTAEGLAYLMTLPGFPEWYAKEKAK